MTTLYQDDRRTIRREGGMLEIEGVSGRKTISLSSAIEPRLTSEVIAAVRKQGFDPEGWYALIAPRNGKYGGGMLAVLPPATREAVEGAIRDYAAEIDAARRDPANVERARIDRLYAEARRHEDYPGDYYRILADADDALKAWREKFPQAAKAERIQELEEQAAKHDSLASGALVYDCDGSFSPAMQEQRAAEFRAKAAEYRAQAARLAEEK